MNGIVVLEMQNEFYDPESFIFVGEMAKAMIPNIQKLIKAARGMKVPLIYCNNTYIKDDYLYGKTPPHCFPGTEQYEIIDEANSFIIWTTWAVFMSRAEHRYRLSPDSDGGISEGI